MVLTLDVEANEMLMFENTFNGGPIDYDNNPFTSSIPFSQGTNTVVFGREGTTDDDSYGNNQIDE